MNAIINQVVILMQREMENTNDSQTVILDNWMRVTKKEMEKIRLMQNPGFDNGQKRASNLARRIIKKSKQEKDSDGEEAMRQVKRSFWKWERSLNRKPQSEPAWFVLPSAAPGRDAMANEKGKKGVLERKERENENNDYAQQGSGREGEVRQGRSMEQYNHMKSFW